MSIKNEILNKMPLSLVTYMRDHKSSGKKSQEIYRNIGVGVDFSSQHKVLLCYVTNTFHIQKWENQKGTRNVECAAFIEALVKNNCRIDVCAYNYDGTINDDYDYVIGFGPAYRGLGLVENFKLKNGAIATTISHDSHNIIVVGDNDEDIVNADYIIMMGREGDENLLPDKNVYLLSPTGLKCDNYTLEKKDFEKAKKHFLWMGSRGAVLKGLDILYDAFSVAPNLVLHVAGLDSVDRRILSKIKPANVIDHGYLQIGTAYANKVFDDCAFFLFPSCSEGVSTSTLTAMNFGLIPLVTSEASVSTIDMKYLKSYHVEDVVREITDRSASDSISLRKEAESIREFARERYSLERYNKTIFDIVQSILRHE